MTSSIKPPGSPGIPSPAGSPADAPKSTAEASFQDAIGDVANASSLEQVGGANAAGAAAQTSPLDLAARLQRGEITAAQAVDQLVEKALASPEAQLLGEAGRAQLEQHLRDELANDPSLEAMVGELG